MKQKKEQTISNAKIAIVFFAFLAFIVGISLAFKVATVIKNGQFDDSKRFTILIGNRHAVEIMSLSPNSKNITVIKLGSGIPASEIGRLLEIPIDGFIASDSLDFKQKVNSLFVNAVINFSKIKTNLTIIDLLKLANLTRSIPESSVNVTEIGGDIIGLTLDRFVGNTVSDDLIEKERQTIQIINGTSVGGLGNRLAKFVTNMGGSVILVATSDSPKKNSTISYIDEKTYTIDRLRKVLGYEVIKDPENIIADITITIGEDKANISPF